MCDCGNTRTCGGMFTSGPGDSEWMPCDVHEADQPFFGQIYAAQTDALWSGRPIPATREEALAYCEKHLSTTDTSTEHTVGDGNIAIIPVGAK